jgi:putative transposase
MCAWLGVSRSGYYAWRGAEPSQRSRDDGALIAVMKKVYEEARGNPGVRRMRAGLAALGHLVPDKRVHRLMQAAGLRGRHPKAWKRTTIGGDRPVPAPDLIGRDFTAAAPDAKWCGDVTYIKTWDGWAYLATVIDLYSRKVIGWAVAAHMRASLVTAALDMAIAARKPPAGVIFHSDRGCQYTSSVFGAYCTENNIRRSLGRTGICYDNAVSESFFATYKKELIRTRPWPTLANLEKETSDWIGNYYNLVRRHSTLGYLTPGEYELGYRQLSQLAA